MQQPVEDQGSPQRWIFFILIAGLIAITMLFLLSRILQHSSPALINSPYSTQNTPRTFQIGTNSFSIPQNMVRKPEQRTKSELKQLDLALLWPSMQGFSREQQVAFMDVSDQSKVILLSLSQPKEVISTSDRLYSIYSQYFVGDPVKGPKGLIGFAMEKNSGFAGETIFFKPDATEPFVARCIAPIKKTPTFCIRELALTDSIQLTYRVRMPMLEHWRELDGKIKSRIEALQNN